MPRRACASAHNLNAPVTDPLVPRRARRMRRTATAALLSLAGAGGLVVTAGPAKAADPPPVRMSAASWPITAAGTTWQAAAGFNGGHTWQGYPRGTDVRGTSEDELYLTELAGMTGWAQAVPNGDYTVTLKMREAWWSAAGQRVFDVTAEGAVMLDDVDIYKAVGQQAAYDRSFRVTVRDGVLNLGFLASRDLAVISAIAVDPATQTEGPTPAPIPAPAAVVARVGSADAAVVDSAGATWSAATGFVGGWSHRSFAAGTDIAGTADDELYQTERAAITGWSMDLPNGAYTVTLKMREGWWTEPGKRVFDVRAEGSLVLDDVDVFAAVGARTAYDRTFTTTVKDGRLDLAFAASRDLPMVSGIAVSTAQPPAPSGGGISIPTVSVSATTNTATIAWTSSSTPAQGWRVERDGADASGYGPWGTTAPGSSRSLTFTNLSAGTTYRLSVTDRDTGALLSKAVTTSGAATPTPTPTPSPSPPPTPVSTTPVGGIPASTATPAWPLAISGDRENLVDAAGKPFFLVGDTAWAMLHGLPVAEAKKYIDARKAQGFNTILTNAVFRDRTRMTPRGLPFVNNDMTRPNEAYWAGVDEIVGYAASRGMTLYVGTIWFAENGGWSGGAMPTDDDLRSYTAFLANRYKGASNLIWFVGGDDSTAKWISKADVIGSTFKAVHPRAVISYHNQYKAPEMQTRTWHDFYSYQFNSNSYPYPYTLAREQLAWTPKKPLLDMEPAYDPFPCCSPDNPDTSQQENRRYGWWTTLSGTTGVVYGGHQAIWDIGFSSGGVVPYEWVNRPAAVQTGLIGKIITRYNWPALQPDWSGTIVDDRRYGTDRFVAAARSADGRLIVAYTPEQRTLTVDLTRLSGPGKAVWIDPRTGDQIGAALAVANSGTRTFDSPLGEDALLILTVS